MKYSILGYDPIGGARFYGIGNDTWAPWWSLIVGCGLLLIAQACMLKAAYAHAPLGGRIQSGERIQSSRQVLAWLILLIFASGVTVLASPAIESKSRWNTCLGSRFRSSLCPVFAKENHVVSGCRFNCFYRLAYPRNCFNRCYASRWAFVTLGEDSSLGT